jgi:L-malate glycosyltransferase
MNVLILTSWYPDEQNKINGNFIQDQAIVLSIEHNITVVSVKINESHFAPFCNCSRVHKNDLGFDEFLIRVSRSFPVYNQLNFFITAFREIKNLVKDKKVDLIHCHNAYPSAVLGYFLGRLLRIPYLVTEHSSTFTHFRTPFHKYLSLFALKHAKSIITVSNFNAEIIRKATGLKVEVVYNVLRTEKYTPDLSQKHKPGQSINIGFLGGLNTDVKGLDILLKAFAQIKDIDLRLHIGGDGLLLNSYKTLAKELNIWEKCIFYGAIDPKEISSFYNKLDFFVVSSRKETFGIVCIEALYHGLPVVSTRCGGPEEIITTIECGILTNNIVVDEVRIAIQIASKKLLDFKKIFISNFINKQFGRENFCKKQNSIYVLLINKI